MNRSLARLCCTVAALAAHAEAQQPALPSSPSTGSPAAQGGQGGATAQPQNPAFPASTETTGQLPSLLQSPYGADPANSIWVLPRNLPTFQGWPVFPSQLSGYGGYPAAVGLPTTLPEGGAKPTLPVLPLGPGLTEVPPELPPGWAGWSRIEGAAPLPFAPDLGLLVRHAERVWWKADAEEPFVPLSFHDKLRTVRSGAAIEVRQAGEFELLLHDSTRLFASGSTALQIVQLAADGVRIDVSRLTWLRLGAVGRAHTLLLPDGSTVVVAATKPAEGEAPFMPSPSPVSPPAASVTDLVFERADEPAWLGGRATMTNLGTTEVTWRHRAGDVVLAPMHRVTFFLTAGAAPIAPEVVVTGGSAEQDGARTICRAPNGGTAAWSGARFELPPGGSVAFDPLVGDRKTP